ncbi:formyl-CoA transferase [Cupriavidus campinensis]|uniref:Formyl-CoA:oxalate CoA-transferase n=1 Tax=Cupriavidus campinensis TaxID=151783 RepID=A0AAE9L637_9BURK|nr:formyl-CoA transferase [Cupriavidus campinensis]URF07875.1 formyl-CoA transferase [Cupriavidus campinensis]
MAEATNQSQTSTMAQRKALDGIRVLDLTHVQAGPSATQLMAWMGADVIKVELPGRGDITRSQLRDVPNADSLYFTMLNSNKRSLTLNMKTPEGKALLEDLIQQSDVLIENFGPGVLARAGFDWEHIQDLNPRMVYASIKGFGPGPYQDCKAYENVAQCMGGAASTTGEASGMPLVTGAQIGDSGTGVHCVVGILGALLQREHSGRGQRVEVAMQDAVLNLCRVKLRDQQRLDAGPLREYPNDQFDDHVPRAGNASGGGQPGAALRCAPGGANDYVYVIIQPQGWEPLMRLCGREDLITDPEFATPEVRLKKLAACFGIIEQWTLGHTKFEVMNALNEVDVPCGPILSMKDLIGDQSMYERGFLMELEHPVRGKYVQLGSPITLSDSPVNVERSPLLGEHTNEILEWLGRSPAQIAALRLAGAI